MTESIVKAAKLIWYDNGMINRFESEEVKIVQINSWLKMMNQDLVKDVDVELSKLSDYELYNVCCGDEMEQNLLASEQANEFLCRIFNEEYLNKDVESLYNVLAHGSDEHREWLRGALEHFFNGKPMPEYKS